MRLEKQFPRKGNPTIGDVANQLRSLLYLRDVGTPRAVERERTYSNELKRGKTTFQFLLQNSHLKERHLQASSTHNIKVKIKLFGKRNTNWQINFPLRMIMFIRSRGGLLVRFRLWVWRIPSLKADSTLYPPRVWAAHTNRAFVGQTLSRWRDAEAWRGGCQPRCRTVHQIASQDYEKSRKAIGNIYNADTIDIKSTSECLQSFTSLSVAIDHTKMIYHNSNTPPPSTSQPSPTRKRATIPSTQSILILKVINHSFHPYLLYLAVLFLFGGLDRFPYMDGAW
ncbi:hypothetical protein AVEN_42230-2 [Araneus ventricosus]|uniref:Uncharacterized protein n=1 Tax=Araneus ventricosus TaxID=182803 RepID=A0A4Y2AYN2_ARAVE|nr:hypothetical protein AVEN_42230-2 [Araneus ventricosus]